MVVLLGKDIISTHPSATMNAGVFNVHRDKNCIYGLSLERESEKNRRVKVSRRLFWPMVWSKRKKEGDD